MELISSFIRDNIFCRFGIPKCILFDSGTPFVNSYGDNCARSKGSIMSSQAPTILKGMARSRLPRRLYCVFLARKSRKSLNDRHIFFLLYYGHTLPRSVLQLRPRLSLLSMGIEVMIASARLTFTSKVFDPNDLIYNIEALEEKKQNVEEEWLPYYKKV